MGLLLAVRSLTLDFRAAGVPARPLAFLRTDVFDALDFGDKNKLRETNSVVVTWNSDLEYHAASLKELIDHRIREQLDLPTVEEAWSNAFEPQDMRGTQHKFHHMIARTLMRPRDLIRFSNSALDEAQRRIKRTGGDALISNEDLRQARRDYSQYLLRELRDEIKPNVPDWDQLVTFLRKANSLKLRRSTLARRFADYAPSLGITRDFDSVLLDLYRFSVIGFQRSDPHTAERRKYFHYAYMDHSIELESDATLLLIHRGLKEVLSLRETGAEDE